MSKPAVPFELRPVKTFEEIASVLRQRGIKVCAKTVQLDHHRAIAKLRRRLGGQVTFF